MVGAFGLVSLAAFFLLILHGFAKNNFIREIEARFNSLNPEEQESTWEIFGKARRVQRSYIRKYLWSWLAMMFITVFLVLIEAPFSPNGTNFLLALVSYVGIIIILDSVRYGPRRERLNLEIAVWLAQNPEGAGIIDRINQENPFLEAPDVKFYYKGESPI